MAAVRKAVVPLGTSLALHLLFALVIVGLAVRRAPRPQEPLQVAVIDVPPPPAEKPAPPPPPPAPTPMKRIARAPRAPATPPIRSSEPPPEATRAPPPPTTEAQEKTPEPVVVTGITMESTSQGGSMAVGVGNTMRGTPEQRARAPEAAKPYKAEKYAPAAQVTELPRPLNSGSVNLRKYYPPEALKEGFEGDVVLRLLIDADGTVARVEIISDPGTGLGPAAARMVKAEYRFSPAKVNGVAVATTVPFTVHFTLD